MNEAGGLQVQGQSVLHCEILSPNSNHQRKPAILVIPSPFPKLSTGLGSCTITDRAIRRVTLLNYFLMHAEENTPGIGYFLEDKPATIFAALLLAPDTRHSTQHAACWLSDRTNVMLEKPLLWFLGGIFHRINDEVSPASRSSPCIFLKTASWSSLPADPPLHILKQNK